METNLEKAKRLLIDHAAISGIELKGNEYLFEMLKLASTPDVVNKNDLLHDVSQQRELLMAYEQFLRNDIDQEKMHNAGLRAEAFLAINCG